MITDIQRPDRIPFDFWSSKLKKGMVVLFILVIWAASATAETYDSSFGFSINIPSHWLIVSSQELKQNPDLLNFNGKLFANMDKTLLEKLKKMILGGQVEYYYYRNTADSRFADNISVYKRQGQLPQIIPESKEVCKVLRDSAKDASGKPARVYDCALTTIGGLNAIYMESDGLFEGRRSISYRIQQSPGVVIVFTATCKDQSLEIITKEFKDILSSIKIR
jgi:hypothetical protein